MVAHIRAQGAQPGRKMRNTAKSRVGHESRLTYRRRPMPLPLVHLAIAMRLYEGRGRPSPSFLLGSIAPDAIHMRKDATTADKHRVHLVRDDDEQRVAAIHDLYQAYATCDDDLGELAGGYASHLLTDLAWVRRVYAGFLQRIPPDCDPSVRRKIYYLDTDQIDFDLYRDMPWRPWAWEQLARAVPVGLPSLLTADEIGRWRDRTLHWFHEMKEEPGVEPRYILRPHVDEFIITTTERIRTLFESWRSG